jgi:hypothetical protein
MRRVRDLRRLVWRSTWSSTGVPLVAATLSALAFAGLAGASSRTAGAQPPVSDRSPTIRGIPQVSQVLQADAGKWRGGDSKPRRLTFQWQACSSAGSPCTELAEATDRIYAARPGDVGMVLRVAVTATNAAGTTRASSELTRPVRGAPSDGSVATTRPTIEGSTVAGAVITARVAAWTGRLPVRVVHRWRRCDAEGGACIDTKRSGDRYRLRLVDVGHTLRVLATARNVVGASFALSVPTTVVLRRTTATPPTNVERPRIAGTPQLGTTLRAGAGTWHGTAPIAYSFQWLRCSRVGRQCGAIAGAAQQSYVVRTTDVGRTLRVRILARNVAGAAAALSDRTRVVTAPPGSSAPPRAVGQPVISGRALERSTLTSSNGSWAGTAPLVFQYRWLRCDQHGGGINGVGCDTIPGETRATYVLAAADVGHRVRSRVIATNRYGTASFNSNATAVVEAVAALAKPASTAPPTVAGSATLGQTVHATSGSWAGAQPITYAYQWRRCDRGGGSCSSIGGATTSSYALKTNDVGTTLRIQVTASNRNGSAAATSGPTPVVVNPDATRAAMPIAEVSLPDRLVVDRVSFAPRRLPYRRRVVARLRVSDSHNRPVEGALVQVIGIPFGRVSTPAEHATGPDGYAAFALYPTRRYHGTGIVFFVRARKAGERLIGGVSTRRLVFLSG